MPSEATCLIHHRAIITCDGQGVTEGTLIHGPYLVQASAVAAIQAHGAVCTGLGDPEALPSAIPATCHARTHESYEWQNIYVGE